MSNVNIKNNGNINEQRQLARIVFGKMNGK